MIDFCERDKKLCNSINIDLIDIVLIDFYHNNNNNKFITFTYKKNLKSEPVCL